MGLDQELRRKYTPKSKIDKTIKALDFGVSDDIECNLLYWRKDYRLDRFMSKLLGGVENCESKELSKDNLISFLKFLKNFHGKPYEEFEDTNTDYTKEIKFIEEIIKKYDDEEWAYYYWAWW